LVIMCDTYYNTEIINKAKIYKNVNLSIYLFMITSADNVETE